MSLPTDRQKQVLDYIQSHIDNDGYPPTTDHTWELSGLEGN